jgi:hypothetical protein
MRATPQGRRLRTGQHVGFDWEAKSKVRSLKVRCLIP